MFSCLLFAGVVTIQKNKKNKTSKICIVGVSSVQHCVWKILDELVEHILMTRQYTLSRAHPSVWGNETNQNETKLQRLFVGTKMGMRFPSRWLVESFCIFVPTKIQNKDCSSERKYRNSQPISDQETSFPFSFCIFVNVSSVYTDGIVLK